MKKTVFFLLSILAYSCNPEILSEEENYIDLTYKEGEENLVSHLSIKAFAADKAFGRGIPELSDLELAFFGVGNAMFDQSWVSAPATTTSRDGLGPIFNARACSACHFRDGRGKPLLETGKDSEGFLIRLSNGNNPITGPIPFNNYGNQLQDNSNLGINKEGEIDVEFKIITGNYPDGTLYELRKPIYSIFNENYGSISEAKTSSRIGQQLIGMGFIDALSASSILANADEFDSDNDGISGRANYVWNIREHKSTIGKFGWKANQPSLEQQIAGAFHGDMGLTTTLFPQEICPKGIDCSKIPNGNNEGEFVEISDTQMNRMLVYMSAISVPIRRKFDTYNVLKGKELFNNLGCIKCHATNFTTSYFQRLPQMSNVKIHPFSDFLLHDMGEDLADNRADFLANGNEWRTQPLWGLGMIEFVNGHTFLLHDGRARSIEEAILWHGGEAKAPKENFMNLSAEKRNQLLSYLNSL